MEWQQACPGGLDETSSTPREDFGKLTLGTRHARIEGWRLDAPGVPELEPAADGLTRLEDRPGGDDVEAFTAGNVMADLGGQDGYFASTEVGRDVLDRLAAVVGLLEHEGQRLADAQR